MYQYDAADRTLVRERVEQFRDQVRRRLAGELTEEQFRPLRLMNGVYLQLHAYMLRVAIPYGTLSSRQLRKLATIARVYDQGWGHITTRQNIQFNWPRLQDIPDILAELAEVEMHAIQTSGNCVRNVTADPFAGVAPDEIEDIRVWGEVLRQWSTLHPEFSYLPRKFKFAISAATEDRAALRVHDVGLRLHHGADGQPGFEVMVGGGQGRLPRLGDTIRPFLPAPELISYLEAILRAYNQLGRRDNKQKARIKILVEDFGIEAFAALVEREWTFTRAEIPPLPEAELARIRAMFAPPRVSAAETEPRAVAELAAADIGFGRWLAANTHAHRLPGHAIVTVSLKPAGAPPGDITADQMDAVADLADRYSFGDIRATHAQNLVLPYVRRADLPALWRALAGLGLASPTVGLVGDIICCPGLDFCSLANARSIPVAEAISQRFADLGRQHDIGPLQVKISGCINACGHHHVGHIGVLGVDKQGEEFYQVTVGGRADDQAALGRIVGPAVRRDQVAEVIERLVLRYLALRQPGETFIDTVGRLGLAPFKEAFHAAHS